MPLEYLHFIFVFLRDISVEGCWGRQLQVEGQYGNCQGQRNGEASRMGWEGAGVACSELTLCQDLSQVLPHAHLFLIPHQCIISFKSKVGKPRLRKVEEFAHRHTVTKTISSSSRSRTKESLLYSLSRDNWTEVATYIIKANMVHSKVSFARNFENRGGKEKGAGVCRQNCKSRASLNGPTADRPLGA